MIRFLEIQGLNCHETLHRPLPKATLVCKNKKRRKNPKEKAHLHQKPSLSHFHNGMGAQAAGQFVMSLDSSGSVRPTCYKPGVLI